MSHYQTASYPIHWNKKIWILPLLKKVPKTLRFKHIFGSRNWIRLKRFFRWIEYGIFCHIQFNGFFVSLIGYRFLPYFWGIFNICVCVRMCVDGDETVHVDVHATCWWHKQLLCNLTLLQAWPITASMRSTQVMVMHGKRPLPRWVRAEWPPRRATRDKSWLNLSITHLTSLPLFSHNTFASSGFFALPFRVSDVNKSAECLMCVCLCGVVSVAVVVCARFCVWWWCCVLLWCVVVVCVLLLLLLFVCCCCCCCGCGCGCGCGCACFCCVCDECLVQSVIFLSFSAIDHCGCQDTYNFLFEKIKKIIPRNYSPRVRQATKTSVGYRKISNRAQHPVRLFGFSRWITHIFSKLQKLWQNRRWPDGIRVEYFPGFNTLQPNWEVNFFFSREIEKETCWTSVTTVHLATTQAASRPTKRHSPKTSWTLGVSPFSFGETPENFTRRIPFMSMFYDISCGTKDNATECLAHAKLVSLYARRFGKGQWSFFGPGSEKEWCSFSEDTLGQHCRNDAFGFCWKRMSNFPCCDPIVQRSTQKQRTWTTVDSLCSRFGNGWDYFSHTCLCKPAQSSRSSRRDVWREWIFTRERGDPLWWDNQVPHSCPVWSRQNSFGLWWPSEKNLLLRQCGVRIEKLSQQDEVSEFCMDAGFLSVVEVGQYFMTKDNGEQFYAKACRKCTLPREEPASQPKGWIQGNTKIGPVLEVPTSYLHGKYGVEIRIWSLNRDCVRISHGSNKFVMNLNKETEIPEDQLEKCVLKLKAEDFACRSKAKAKQQTREPACSSPKSPLGEGVGLTLHQGNTLSPIMRYRRK